MKTVCSPESFTCDALMVHDTLSQYPLSLLGIACGVFVVASVIRFVFLN